MILRLIPCFAPEYAWNQASRWCVRAIQHGRFVLFRRIPLNSSEFLWFPLNSSEFRWIPLNSAEFLWFSLNFAEFRWVWLCVCGTAVTETDYSSDILRNFSKCLNSTILCFFQMVFVGFAGMMQSGGYYLTKYTPCPGMENSK